MSNYCIGQIIVNFMSSSEKPTAKSSSFFNCCSCGDGEAQKEAVVDLKHKDPDHTSFSKINGPSPYPVGGAVHGTTYTHQIHHETNMTPMTKIYNPSPVYNGPIVPA